MRSRLQLENGERVRPGIRNPQRQCVAAVTANGMERTHSRACWSVAGAQAHLTFDILYLKGLYDPFTVNAMPDS